MATKAMGIKEQSQQKAEQSEIRNAAFSLVCQFFGIKSSVKRVLPRDLISRFYIRAKFSRTTIFSLDLKKYETPVS